MAAAQAAENPGDEWGLTWYILIGKYTSIPTWPHPQNPPTATEALNLKNPPMEHPLNDHKDHPNQHESSHKQCDEIGHLVVKMMERWSEFDLNFPMVGKPL